MDARKVVRIGTAGELAAAVPALIGFTPGDGDVVVVARTGTRVGVTLRAELPPQGLVDRFARQLAAAIRRAEPDAQAVDVIGWNVATGEVDVLAYRLRDAGLGVGVLVTVQHYEGAWRYLDTSERVDAPVWAPLPLDVTVRPALIASTGATVAGSRAELHARIAAGEAMPDEFDVQTLAELDDVHYRDERVAALARLTHEELLPLREHYARLCRVGSGEARSAALCLVALASWLTGDGAMARVALDDVHPGYSLASLLTTALDAAVSPTVLRTWLTQAGELL